MELVLIKIWLQEVNMKAGDTINTIKFSKINNPATEMHNLEMLDISEDKIFDKNMLLYHPCNLNLFITNVCHNNCFFCINGTDYGKEIKDDIYYYSLQKALKELSKKQFEITITGGEPTLKKERFVKTIQLCNEYGLPCRTVSTTGLALLDYYDNKPLCQHLIENNFTHNINISRMHWDEMKNSNLFEGKNITNNDIQNLAQFFYFNNAEMRISCNIIPGYIDDFNKMLKFVDFYRKRDVETIMFRELIARDFIPLSKILDFSIDNGFKYIKTLDGFDYIVDIYQYKDMIVKHYKTKPTTSKEIIFSLAFKNGVLIDNFCGKNIYIDLKEGFK